MVSYHDNKVTFRSLDNETTAGGSFTVIDYCITPGQDPDNRNSKAQVVPLEGGDFKFIVGRQGSGTVADFFNSHIKSNENTFGHGPGKLNFAFYGTLQLSISGGNVGRETTLTFNNVCLAQGKDGGANNWWFGISGAQRSDSGSLERVRTTDAEGKFTVDFCRGDGTGVSTVGYRINH